MIDQIFASQGKRVLDRLMPEGSMRAEPTLLYNLKVIFDEASWTSSPPMTMEVHYEKRASVPSPTRSITESAG